jgi:hypothetical protein
MDYPISDEFAKLQNGKFTDGDPINNIPPSKNSAAYQNMVFDELLNVLSAAGITPDENSVNQLAAAINSIANSVATTITTNAITALLDGAPDALDTLNELAAALADDQSFAATMTTALAGKSANGHGHAMADIAGLPGNFYESGVASVNAGQSLAVLNMAGKATQSLGCNFYNNSTTNGAAPAAYVDDTNLIISNSDSTTQFISWWVWYD